MFVSKIKEEPVDSVPHIKIEAGGTKIKTEMKPDKGWEPAGLLQPSAPVKRKLDTSSVSEPNIKKQKRAKKFSCSANKFPCSKCIFNGRTALGLKNHTLDKHGRQVPCLVKDCDFIGTVHSLLCHKKQAHKKMKAKKFPCSECKFSGVNAKGLMNHTTDKHGRQVCCPHDNCSFVCAASALQKHTQSKHPAKLPCHGTASSLSSRAKACAKCNFVGTAMEMKTHTKTKHPTVFPCPRANCNYSGTVSNLKIHIKAEHTNCNFVVSDTEIKIHTNANHDLKVVSHGPVSDMKSQTILKLEPLVTCSHEYCPFTGTPSDMARHTIENHGPMVQCPHVNCNFFASSLASHEKEKHGLMAMSTRSCTQDGCNFTSLTVQEMKEHGKLHGIIESGLLQIAQIQEDIIKASRLLAAHQ